MLGRLGAQDITDHYTNPQGAPAVGTPSEASAATGPTLGNALLCSIACDLPPAGLVAIERSEQTSFDVATEAMSQPYRLMAQVAVST
ncbi:MAG: hypothetical protein PHV02_18820 [Rhodocyclaceae bacterium]|nr:hypothetical protein [Rhodocyclaceae bacterium]